MWSNVKESERGRTNVFQVRTTITRTHHLGKQTSLRAGRACNTVITTLPLNTYFNTDWQTEMRMYVLAVDNRLFRDVNRLFRGDLDANWIESMNRGEEGIIGGIGMLIGCLEVSMMLIGSSR